MIVVANMSGASVLVCGLLKLSRESQTVLVHLVWFVQDQVLQRFFRRYEDARATRLEILARQAEVGP